MAATHNYMQIKRLRIVAAVLIAGPIPACESPVPANKPPPQSERELVVETLESIAQGHQNSYSLERAGPRGRWEDVPDALRWAIAEEGVEMGLLSTRELVDGYFFELITVEGWPATLTIRRGDASRIYEATAEVGRFPDLIDRNDRATALLRAFDDWMTALGAKPRLVPMVNPGR